MDDATGHASGRKAEGTGSAGPAPSSRAGSGVRYERYQQQRKANPDWSKAPDWRDRAEGRTTPKSKQRSRSFGQLFAAFWGLLRGHRSYVVLALTTVTITTLLALVMPAATKIAIDYIITDNPGPTGLPTGLMEAIGLPAELLVRDRVELLWWLGGAVVLLGTVAALVGIVGRWQMTRVTKRVQVELRRRTFARAIVLPLHRVQHYKAGGMASLLREDAGLAGELLFSLFYNPWRAIVQFAGTLLVLAWTDWRLLLGGLLLVPAVWVTHRAYIARIRPLYRDAKQARQVVDASTTEAFSGVRVVRGFARGRTEATRFVTGQHFMARIEVLTWWWSRLVEVAWAVLIPVASALVLVYGGSRVMRGEMTLGDLMMFTTYVLMLLGPLETLTSTATSVQTNLAALDRVLHLLDEDAEFAHARGADAPAPVVLDHARVRGAISLRGVGFAYPRARAGGGRDAGAASPTQGAEGDAPLVLSGISLDVRPGETIALVGRSGAGKTTLCNLVARFYDPTHGQVLLDGRDLRDIDVASYRSLLGIVEQDVFLFDGTVADNIAYARRDATGEQILAAARAAHAHEFISEMEKGYDTLIGERGVRLSGGQKQRIAIARAILADPRILILDEATSNLDTQSERLIQRSLADLMRGRTSFIIAHRLSTIRNADRIVVLEGGRIVEMGTHEQLEAKAGGVYARLLHMQTAGDEHALNTLAQ